MATKKQATEVEAFVLMDCGFGKAGEVVVLTPEQAAIGVAHGMLDTAAAAVEYAKSQAE